MRKQFYPDDAVAFAGINTWRGITRRKPFLTGRSYTRTGSILTGKMVIYPIIDNVDGDGNQLINWMAEIKQDTFEQNDWNQPGNLADFFDLYRDWHFPWLDVPDLIRTADQILEYPMVDKDPVARWTFGRVTLAGDAAHPMYPRGSNGAAQGAIDARTLADCLAACRAAHGDPRNALRTTKAGAWARLPGGAHQPRPSAGFHQHQGRGAGRRPAVRRPRQVHHPGRAARAVGELQAGRGLLPARRGGTKPRPDEAPRPASGGPCPLPLARTASGSCGRPRIEPGRDLKKMLAFWA